MYFPLQRNDQADKQLAPQRRADWGWSSQKNYSRGLSWEQLFSVIVCILSWIHDSLGPENGITPGDMRKEGGKAYCSYNCLPQTLSPCAVSMGYVRNMPHLPLHRSEKCPVGSLSFWLLPKVRFLQELPHLFLDVRLQGSLFRPLLKYCLCEWSFKKKGRKKPILYNF